MIVLTQQGRFGTILLNINIDGTGYREGGTYFSPFDLPPEIEAKVREVTRRHALVREGPQWVQGDHSIFVQQGCPAIAVSSQWFIDHLEDQRITHTAGDHPGIVSCETLASTAVALADLIRSFGA